MLDEKHLRNHGASWYLPLPQELWKMKLEAHGKHTNDSDIDLLGIKNQVTKSYCYVDLY